MAAFATPEWIDALSLAASDVTVDPSVDITVEHRIEAEPPIAWHFILAGGSLEVVAGNAAAPTISLSSSAATSIAIHSGELSAQRAFLDGALRIGGDVNALITHRAALGIVGEILSAAI